MRNKFRERLNSRFSDEYAEYELNPMDGVANLADVMLVLACGLMLALIINWNVKINTEPQDGSTPMTEVETPADGDASALNQDEYAEVGKVYYDKETGKYYMVVDADAAALDGSDGLQADD
jgi:hypothetical protein